MNIENHLNFIRKIVWSYVKKNPNLVFEDLFSEACLACLERSHYYNPDRGAETTFIWQVVHSRINDLLKIGKRRQIPTMLEEEADLEDITEGVVEDPEHQLIIREEWNEFFNTLSEEAKVVCSLVLNEAEIFLPTDKPKLCQSKIKSTLRDRGWSSRKIRLSCNEIKFALTQIR